MPSRSDIEERPVAAAVLSYLATRGFDRSPVGPGHVLRFQVLDHNGAIGLRDPACHAMGPMLSDACDLRLYLGQVFNGTAIAVASLLAPAHTTLEKPGSPLQM